MSPYENDGYDSDGEDISLTRWMLSMTPAERFDVLQSFADELDRFRLGGLLRRPPGVSRLAPAFH